MAHYNLIFQGKIIDGASLDEVKNNVARLFKADAAKTAALFSGKPIVIKKNLDTDAAKKYLSVMKKAGAIVKAVKINTLVNTSNKAPKQTQAPIAAQAESGKSTSLSPGLASLINYNQTKETVSEEDDTPEKNADEAGLQLAPVGTNHSSTTKSIDNAIIPDTSYLTLSAAQSGSLEEFASEVEAVELPDIDKLSMSEANTGSLEEFSKPVEAVELPDISQLDIHEQDDTPLSDQSDKITPIEIPDITDLSMSEAQEGSLEGLGIKVDTIEIPDTSHLEVEKLASEKQITAPPQGKATFQIN